MWIDRILSDSPDGQQITDLHKRLTVIGSADSQRRREAFDRVASALTVTSGTTLEVHTEYGDAVSAHRTSEGTALFDTRTKLPVHAEDRSLGIVGWLNNAEQMKAQMPLFHVDANSLRNRVEEDADLIRLAQTPLDQLFELADEITTAETAVAQAQDERSDLSDSKRERDSREKDLQVELEEQRQKQKTVRLFTFAAMALVIAGVAAALLVALPVGLGICILGVVVAVLGKVQGKRSGGGEASAEALAIQLGRVDELFDTQNLTRNRRSAETNLEASWEQWRSIAGDAKPSILLKDRPRIEELASHLQLISRAEVSAPGDTSILVGFASLLAELARRFPAERVPLLVADVFPEIAPQYHPLMRELLLRGSHRRQVLIETGDLEACKWAAVEAVGGDALVITDYDIDVEPIIAAAVSTEDSPTV